MTTVYAAMTGCLSPAFDYFCRPCGGGRIDGLHTEYSPSSTRRAFQIRVPDGAVTAAAIYCADCGGPIE